MKNRHRSHVHRFLAQFAVACGGAVARVVAQTYNRTTTSMGMMTGGGGVPLAQQLSRSLCRRMSPAEAAKILDVDIARTSHTEVNARFQRLFEINAPTPNFGGSPYLQHRIQAAKSVLDAAIQSR